MFAAAIRAVLVCATAAYATNIVISNDDGWATAQIRQQFDALARSGHNVVLSAPALNQSGKGSLSTTPAALDQPCQFDTCPTGSPAQGSNNTDSRLNYVNAYPVDAVRHGIETIAPNVFDGSKPEFVVSGPNIGGNLGLVVLFSGTVGAACEAARQGIPAVAFSGKSGSQVSYTTLESAPNAPSSISAHIYSELTTYFVDILTSNAAPFLPDGVIVNVNYASIDKCRDAASYQWIFSRLITNIFVEDVETCGSSHLPNEASVVASGCYASVSVISAHSKLDVNATLQGAVKDRLEGLPFTCLSRRRVASNPLFWNE